MILKLGATFFARPALHFSNGVHSNGVYSFSGLLRLENSVISGNHGVNVPGAGNAAAVRVESSTAWITNSTIAGNYYAYGILLKSDSRVILNNSLVWANSTTEGSLETDQIKLNSLGNTVEVNNCVIQGWTGLFGGDGNSGADPLFVRNPSDGGDGWGDNSDTPDIDESVNDDIGDLRLGPESPAIDSGDPLFVPDPGETDFYGHPRVLCDRVDIGAFEFGIGDVNCDGRINLSDFRSWSFCMTDPNPTASGELNPILYSPGCESFDFNTDGDVDLEDYKGFMETLFEFSFPDGKGRPVRR